MRIIICDDEADQLDILEEVIRDCSLLSEKTPHIERYTSGIDLLGAINVGKPIDYVFLDIEMPGMNGLAVSRELARCSDAAVIFVSTHTEMMPEVFAHRPFCFLYKPYTQDIFDRTMRSVIERQMSALFLKYMENGRIFQLPCADIRYIEIYDHNLIAFSNREIPLPRDDSMDDIQKKLESFGFFRCHRAFLIHLRYYANRSKKTVMLNGEKGILEVPLSRNRLDQLDKAYLKYKVGALCAF